MQTTDRPRPPQGGSGVHNKSFGEVVVPFVLDISQLDDAQKKADKLKATLLEVQELIRQTNLTGADIENKIIADITDAAPTQTRELTNKEIVQRFAELVRLSPRENLYETFWTNSRREQHD